MAAGSPDDDRVIARYLDNRKVERSSPAESVARVRDILAEGHRGGRYAEVVRLVPGGSSGALAGQALRLEDGGELVLGAAVPPDLPFGYHEADTDAGPALVLHAPTEVPDPGGRPGWVVVAQLYASRSRQSWGHGDLRDARHLLEWVEAGGAGGHLMINPLHAPPPGPDPEPSPYFASSRVFRNPLYLAVDELAGADAVDLDDWRADALALDDDPRLDRRTAWAIKRPALAAVWAEQRADPGVVARVDRWLADPVHRRYASWCTATEAGREPPAAADVVLDAEASDDERFQAWLQLELEDQLHRVGEGLVHDVAVGTRPGADTWLWPECYVLDGTRVGAPPDSFNTQGQDWGLPPYHPEGLRSAGYEPFVRAVRSSLWGAAGIRIDHIMGLERLYWIPAGASPREGVYVRYDLDEMLDVLAIEAHRAAAFVVGEDLGTVSPAIRTAMDERGLLSYRVMALNPRLPATYPQRSMAAVTTHDLPTVTGLLSGRDLEAQADLGLEPNVKDTETSVTRLREWIGAGDEELGYEELTVRLYELLAGSPACLVAATLEDMALAPDRPNMPGTTSEQWPNWSVALPQPIEDVTAGPTATRVRSVLAARTEVTHTPEAEAPR